MEAKRSSETSMSLYGTARRHIQEQCIEASLRAGQPKVRFPEGENTSISTASTLAPMLVQPRILGPFLGDEQTVA
jgi:hypothetical protein